MKKLVNIYVELLKAQRTLEYAFNGEPAIKAQEQVNVVAEKLKKYVNKQGSRLTQQNILEAYNNAQNIVGA